MGSSLGALNALNFFMADVRDGLGPFLGVFLQGQGWQPAEIGLVMTLGGYAGMLATTPLGMLVDGTRSKRGLMVAAALAVAIASMGILAAPNFAVTALSQVMTGVAGAVVMPAIAGITLGLVRQAGFAHQLGRNEAFNHAGNVFAALLGGGFGYLFGLQAIFFLLAAMALASIAAALAIDPRHIDHVAARGGGDGADGAAPPPASLAVLYRSRPLLVLAVVLMLFHLGNAAMLPLLGQALVARGAGDPSAFTAATIIVAQLTMIPMALLAARLAETRGYWVLFVAALAALPIRGVLAAFVTNPWGLVPIQVLDGVGAGLLGVAVPGLVARILAGSGHVNAGLGAVMTLQAVGAASSTALAGMLAQSFGYAEAFLALGGIAAAGLLLWLLATSVVGPACRGTAPA
ncbi:putative MFS family arabinose efflux permease [Stella humosa]|uniref:Putative MFS family arabinose efflux permease n=1 Tax=Stella humosa TaxID=94 RepID=A0A3N1L969_9PROT|nr:MFS transporter [Stella humosa]ROP91243.1 putative MFS family arabinose efflux permease [Stella humosa]BBK34403.1 MFS transporter [Stella humosa]